MMVSSNMPHNKVLPSYNVLGVLAFSYFPVIISKSNVEEHTDANGRENY